MSNNYFQFKKFLIRQDDCAMKVGTDGVLLGAWVNVKGVSSVLDIGTGTGLIALMLAQRTEADITAIEIDESAAIQAKINIDSSPWAERITLKHQSFQEYWKGAPKNDLIVSNPPFFSNSLSSPLIQRTMARHDTGLNLKSLFKGVSLTLSPQGVFALIYPSDQMDVIQQLANKYELYPGRQCAVLPTPAKAPKRMMFEFSFTENKIKQESLIIEKYGRHKYSEEYSLLCKDFYLNL